MNPGSTLPLAQPPEVPISGAVVAHGAPVPPIERIRLFSDGQWEDFVLEWADSLRDRYQEVMRCAGAGDMGRDVIGVYPGPSGQWDNFQCKHYRQPLAPSDVWLELGKLAYYTYIGAYSYPKRYYFVSPHGVGTKLSNLLKKPEGLKGDLMANWGRYCVDNITATKSVHLDPALRAYIDGLDFGIFAPVQPLRLIEEHSKTRWHTVRFGGGLPPRPPCSAPPATPASEEATYVRELLNAYGDHLRRSIGAIEDLQDDHDLLEHFADSRIEFYSAESLRAFSRDTLPPGEFEKLQDEVHSGIRDEIRAEHESGYRRVVAVVRTARALQLGGHPLQTCLAVRDRGGICHQLANDNKLRWTR